MRIRAIAAAGTVATALAGGLVATGPLVATAAEASGGHARQAASATVGAAPVTTATVGSAPVAAAVDDAAWDATHVVIPDLGDVRGNITLPTVGENGSALRWTSSAPAVITPTGEVTRPAHGSAALHVTLTVTATSEGASSTATYSATVQPLPEEQPYEAYLFSYFTGSDSTVNGERIYFAASEGNDALNWQRLNDDEPVLTSTKGTRGLRDPFIIRSPEGDRFYMIATDLWIAGGTSWYDAGRTGSQYLEIWESTDLVNWGEQRHVKVGPDTVGHVWAPEATYDESTGEYVVYWASPVYPEGDSREDLQPNRMYYATTRDFVTFSEPVEWFSTGTVPATLDPTELGTIDSTVIEEDGTYYRFTKAPDVANNCLDIVQHRSTELRDTSWDVVATCVRRNAGLRRDVEGPLVFEANPGDVNGQAYYLFVDEYTGRGYLPLRTQDLDDPQWTLPAAWDLPDLPRHGTVLPVTRTEYDRLLQNFQPDAFVATVEGVALTVTAGQAPALPTTVAVRYGDGTTGVLPVTWDAVDPAAYAAPGQLTVRGGLGEAITARAAAVVTVTPAALPAPEFADVVAGQPFYDEVRWMATRGLSLGTQMGDERFYYPTAAVSRQAMAAFLYRYAAADEVPAEGAEPTFTDVGPDHHFYAQIEWMAARGLASGYDDGTFGPTVPVSRQAMAAFLHRYAGEPEGGAPEFTDVPAGHDAAAAIGWLRSAGIAEGYPNGTFGMSQPVSRQAMAAFLQRTDDFLFRAARTAD